MSALTIARAAAGAAVTCREIVDREAWNALVARLPHYDLRQGYEWGEVRASQGWLPVRLAAFRGEECVAAAALLVRRLPLLGWSALYASGGPLLADPADEQAWDALLGAVRRVARRTRAVFLRVSPKVAHADGALAAALRGRGFTALPDDWTTWNSPRIVMAMDVRDAEETLIRRLRRRFREHIAAAPRRAVAVRPADSREEGGRFHAALAAGGRRKGLPVRGREYFERLWREYVRSGKGVLLVAEHAGEAVGGLLGVRFGEKAYMLHVTLRDPQGERLHVGPLLYWEFVRWAKRAGCTRVDWGGIGTNFPPRPGDPGLGIYHFKRGFHSSLEYLAGYFDLVFAPRRYRGFRFLERRPLAAAWKARAVFNDRFQQTRNTVRTAARKLRQFKVSASQRGFLTTLYWAAFGFLRPNRLLVFARDLRSLPRRPSRPAPESVRFETWEAAAVRAWRAGRRGLRPEFFQDEIDGVDTCAVALVDGELAGLTWIYRAEDASRLFRLREGEAELNNAFVVEARRGLGLLGGMLWHACQSLREQGVRTVYAMVHSGNAPSLRAVRALGFQEVGSVRHFLVYRPKFTCAPLPVDLDDHGATA